jgi:putative phosphoribosyl transferase
MHFSDRFEAAAALIPLLSKYKEDPGVILAIPRGGVPVASPIAKSLGFPLELLMTKKIGHPLYPEFAVGAVSLEDHTVDPSFHIPGAYIESEVKRIRRSLRDRYKEFTGDHVPVTLRNKTVLIIDDGIATGNTVLSSIKMLRQQQPARIIVAVPVAPADTIAKLRAEVDDVICLYIPDPFYGVGMHYTDFSQVSDDEVRRLLEELRPAEN